MNFEDNIDDESKNELDWVLEQLEDSYDEDESPVVKEKSNDESALQELWKSLSPPQTEESILQKWYGIIYDGKKKSYLYVGKATGRFLMMLMVLYLTLTDRT